MGIYSLNPEGNIRWKMLPDEGTTSAMSPVIDRNGNIYIGFKDLYCLSYEGSILWKKNFYIISNNLLIDGLDNILFTLTNPSQAALESIIQIDQNGDIVNQINISTPSIAQYYSPAISNNMILLPIPFTSMILLIN